MRVFFALQISQTMRLAIDNYVSGLKRRLSYNVGWIFRDNYHVTLRFVGEVDKSAVSKLADSTEDALDGCASFSLNTAGSELFPARRRSQVFVLKIGPENYLSALARLIDTAVTKIGLLSDPRPFRPHLTLARIRSSVPFDFSFESPPPISCTVDQVVLYESRLCRPSPVYVPLERMFLNPICSFPEVREGDPYGT